MVREQALRQLEEGGPFDLLIVGGGATGCGVALEAASRGLRTALIEKNDIAEGTSGRSTKLVHGGVRYLEAAVRRLDRSQYHLVREALHERGVLLRNAPHLCTRLSLVTPLYRWREVPYVLAGLKLYDALAGKLGIGASRLLGRRETVRQFPLLEARGLRAGVSYFDGQFNDARAAVALALTARDRGAVIGTHVRAVELLRERGRTVGAGVRDTLGGRAWEVRARGVINATGPFSDELRRMDDPNARPLLQVSSGIHVVLDGRFAPAGCGLLIPKTDDGRVLFVLPWEGHALVGTTDEPAPVEDHPPVTPEAVDYLLRHLNRYLRVPVSRSDIKATWAGLRPLVFDARVEGTSRLTRDHVIQTGPSGLLTVAGGKWTTYRRMAQDTVDLAAKTFGLNPNRSRTERIPLRGADRYDPQGHRALTHDYGIDPEVARHLNSAYGDRAVQVARLAEGGLGTRLHPEHPYLEAEVVHAARSEFAARAIDVLARRTPLALVDHAAAEVATPRVVALMGDELGWDPGRRENETVWTRKRIQTAF